MDEGLVVLVKSLLAFFSLLIFTKILGKKQFNRLTYFDYILGISIGSIAGGMSADSGSRAWPYFIGLTTWCMAVLVLQFLTLKSHKLSKFLDGEATIIIQNGKIHDKAMKKMRLRISDLLELLRQKDAFDITQIEYAIIEKSGKLSVLKKAPFLPATPNDLNITTTFKSINTDLVFDGKFIDENLDLIGKNRNWLISQLKSMNITDVSEIFYASINTEGTIYVDRFSDGIHQEQSIK